MNNGISPKAPAKEKIKSDFECLIRGMNWTGMIDSVAYDYLFDEVMPMFDKMYELGKKESTSWHPYPKEKPKRDKEYLVTCVHQDGNKFIFVDFWFSATGEGKWFTAPEKVSAWAELPEPYRQEAKNE